jgi:hypothetical protein
MNMYGALVEWYCWVETEVLREKPVPMPLCLPHMGEPGPLRTEFQWTKYDRQVTEIPTHVLEAFTATEFE